jgi:hypothetical protein
MGWQTDRDKLAVAVDAAIADANRTLEMKSTGNGWARVMTMVVEELVYDEDADDLVRTGELAVRQLGEWL